jgi:hypothetical protein
MHKKIFNEKITCQHKCTIYVYIFLNSKTFARPKAPSDVHVLINRSRESMVN